MLLIRYTVSECEMTTEQNAIRQLEVKQATEISAFYGVPQSLVNMFFLDFGGTAYPKAAFLLYQAHKKGVQRIEVTVNEEPKGMWEAEARIYPAVTSRIIENLAKLSEKERATMWEYLTKPTVEWGKASKDTVRMSTMQPYLKEMAIKRAVARACRLFSGIGTTAFEELPDATMSEDDVRDAARMAKPVTAAIVENETASTPSIAPPAQPASVTEAATTDGMTRESLAYELREFAGDIEVVDGVDGLTVNVLLPMAKEKRGALAAKLAPFKPSTGIDKGKTFYHIKVA